MRVLVTGATGFVGSTIVRELIDAGHQVTGLARSDAGTKSLTAAGAKIHRGDLEDLESLRSGAAMSDGVIHTAFIHDFSNFRQSSDRRARNSDARRRARGLQPPVRRDLRSRSARAWPHRDRGARAYHPIRIVSAGLGSHGRHGGRARRPGVNVRLAPSVHGDGDDGFVPRLIAIAREKGVSAYVGDGPNRWPGVHRLDAAHLYRLALEMDAAGASYHGIAEEGADA